MKSLQKEVMKPKIALGGYPPLKSPNQPLLVYPLRTKPIYMIALVHSP